MNFTFGSVCSGIEAASVAFAPLGWKAAWFSEIEPFPSSVLAYHYPQVPNLGDMTCLPGKVLIGHVPAPEMLCGGTPCQAFSVAGKRESLDDERGNLSLVFCELANAIDDVRVARGDDPAVILWENVPGVLSTKDNAFGCFLAGLAGEDEPLVPPGQTPKPGEPWKWANAGAVYGPRRAIAWRTLDAQYFGLAQRRRRVFVVASARNGFDPAQVLFEWNGVRRDSAPSREARQVAPTIPARSTGGGGLGTDFDCDGGLIPELAKCLTTGTGLRYDTDTDTMVPVLAPTLDASFGRLQGCSGQDLNHGHSHLVAHTLRGDGFDASEDGTGRGTPLVPVAFDTTQITSVANRSNPKAGDPCHPLAAGAHAPAIAFDCKASGQNGFGVGDIASTMRAMGHAGSHQNGGGHQAVAYTTKLHNTGSNNAGKLFKERTTCLDANSPPPELLTATQVRRLTPRECERLMGFPDDYTLIPCGKRNWTAEREEMRDYFERTGQTYTDDELDRLAADGPRYKALGNSWAVPCARWIGQRIQGVLS